MIAEKTITICGKEVRMRYCAASETGYEVMSNKGIDVFAPLTKFDEDGNPMQTVAPKATTDDYIKLAMTSIIAAYACLHEEPPITSEDIMYNASSQELYNMILTVAELRNEWYRVPDVVTTDIKADRKRKKKNG